MGLDTLTRHVKETHQKKKENRKKGGIKPWEMERVNPAVNETEMFRFLYPGENVDIFIRKFHWPEGQGPSTCTSEIAEFSGHCCYCHYHEAYMQEQKKKQDEAKAKGQKYNYPQSRLRQQEQHIMELIDFRFYHVVEGEKAEGSNEPEKSMEKCNVDGPDGDPERCEHCSSSNPEEAKRVFGGHRLWEMKSDYMDQLMAAHQRLQKVCVHVDEQTGEVCGKEAYVVGLQCEKCKNDLVDPAAVRKMSTKDIESLMQPQECSACKHKGYPDLQSACKSDQHEAVRGQIWDKNLIVTCVGETKEIKQAGGKTIEYEARKYSFDSTQEPFCTVMDYLLGWGFEEEEVEKMCAPWDLDYYYRPEWISLTDKETNKDKPVEDYVQEVLNKQAEKLNKPNPWSATGTQSKGTFGSSQHKRSFQRR